METKNHFWQRINTINPNTVDKIIGFGNINRFYYHQAPDPGHRVFEVPELYKNKVTITNWFESKKELENLLLKSAVYFAPRYSEGIGMSFLDAMALGRCVVALNMPTMNEYITNGVNGYLYDFKNQQRMSMTNIREIQKNTIDFIKSGYERWKKEKYQILDWLDSDPAKNSNPELLSKYCRREIQKKKISFTYLKIKITDIYKTYYLMGFIPIYRKRNHTRWPQL